MIFAQYRSQLGYVSLYEQRKQYAYGTCTTPDNIGENRSRWTRLLAVKARAPIVRPWNAPRKAMKRFRRVLNLASFNAASFASVPLFARNTFFGRSPGAISASFSASRACAS